MKQTLNNPDFNSLQSSFENILLKNLRYNNLELRGKTFENCEIENFYLPSLSLENSSHMNCVFQKTNLEEAVVIATSFYNCLMTDLKAKGAHFEGVSFYKTDLRGSTFENASFEGCFFEGADLSSVDFSGADLSLSNLYGCHSVVGATFDHKTKLPFSIEEAKRLGMVSKKSHLKVATTSFDQPSKDKLHKKVVNKDELNNVLDLNEYRKNKKKA